jgi:hypothetical protein
MDESEQMFVSHGAILCHSLGKDNEFVMWSRAHSHPPSLARSAVDCGSLPPLYFSGSLLLVTKCV